jgi:2-polyprenyl-3-methyl-5-hydroxy-6-metoxy-1,4-benzoquinol methylase
MFVHMPPPDEKNNEHPTSTHNTGAKQRKQVRLQERAFSIGSIVGINAYRVNRTSLKQRIVEGGYQIQETPHFLICTQTQAQTLIIHWYAPQAVDSDLGQHFLEEMKPLGLLTNTQQFGDVFAAVVNSLCPHDPQRAWHLFGTNTLQRFHQLLDEEKSDPHDNSPIAVFAALYRRVSALVVGDSLLDAGCSFGFLPLVIAERMPTLKQVVGVDISDAPFPVTRAIAQERHVANVAFMQGDLLADDFSAIGQFDTVTALHVLEHFTESDMYRVLANLLKVTSRRLMLAVPFEAGEMERVYGHQQLFTRAKLEAVGRWCLEQLGGGCMSYEDCAGGMIVIDVQP